MLEILNCRNCLAINNLPSGCSPTPGDGAQNSPIFLFLNEKSDILSCSLSSPFSDVDGDFLRKILKEIGIPRTQTYFTSLVKCTEFSPKNAKICGKWLDVEKAKIQPKFIVAFGKQVTNYLLPEIDFSSALFSKVGNIYIVPSLHKLFNGSSKDVARFSKGIKKIYELQKDIQNR